MRPSTPGSAMVCFNLSVTGSLPAGRLPIPTMIKARAKCFKQAPYRKSRSKSLAVTTGLIRRRRTDAGQTGGEKGPLYSFRQFSGRTASPIVEKQNARLLVRHVLMDCNNCGRNARKKSATLGFRTFVRTPWRKAAILVRRRKVDGKLSWLHRSSSILIPRKIK